VIATLSPVFRIKSGCRSPTADPTPARCAARGAGSGRVHARHRCARGFSTQNRNVTPPSLIAFIE
jgi:hypothetical protein